MSERKGLEGLLAWQKSMEFAKHIYKEVIPLFPKEEKWVMGSQLRRAASSIPANLAEGYGRFYYQEGVRFSYIARGSLEETLTFLTLAKEIGCLPLAQFESLENEVLELKRIISGYIAYLKKSKPGQHEPGADFSVRDDHGIYSTEEFGDVDV